MSDDIRKLQAQIDILTEKASDLEVICAWLFNALQIEDSLVNRKTFVLEFEQMATAHQSEIDTAPDRRAFRIVADHILSGSPFVGGRFGSSGAIGPVGD